MHVASVMVQMNLHQMTFVVTDHGMQFLWFLCYFGVGSFGRSTMWNAILAIVLPFFTVAVELE